jgi:transmembrane sensor
MERIQYLLRRYLSQTCTEEEKTELARWIEEAQHDDALREALEQAWLQHRPLTPMPDEVSDRVLSAVFEAGETPVVNLPARRRARWRWAAAAGVVLLCGAAALLFRQQPKEQQLAGVNGNPRYKNEVLPGGNKAMLTLADGSTITLDSAANGTLAQQGNASITKLANGQLAYNITSANNRETLYNTMTTPRGGQYRLTLPDGTQVWLNAASSITYPVAFTGKERMVRVTGEAYFEVAADARMPFRVSTGKVAITVLGTSFNLNAYTESAVVKTTLINGAVSVSDGKDARVLRPGQQAKVSDSGMFTVADNVDTEEAIAWKNGYFQFSDADMPTVMQQLEKWYDIKVTYEGDIPQRSFGGGMQRSLPLSAVLGILEENGVKFRIDERNITVLK